MKRFFLFACLLLAMTVSAFAEEPIPIRTPEELAAVAQNPEGSYILMNDIDMAGIAWKSVDFSGTLDGNGKAILNLTIADPGDSVSDSIDGNSKTYPTNWYGLFGTLDGASVKNLSLYNVQSCVAEDNPAFIGGIAGCSKKAQITNCTVEGTLELRAHDRMFGVGGIAGYGAGNIENCTVDVTLITVDTDDQHKDEQFLGGICAVGFFYVFDCDVTIDGYISEHGYVHSGGVTGMYMRNPYTGWDLGEMSRNTVRGKITFFEHNNDRRAYCKGVEGELLEKNYRMVSNDASGFLRDEVRTYDVELRPEMCEEPEIQSMVMEPTCYAFGYTQNTCTLCGHVWRDGYRLKTHSVSGGKLAVWPTIERSGVMEGLCTDCGDTISVVIPAVELHGSPR